MICGSRCHKNGTWRQKARLKQWNILRITTERWRGHEEQEIDEQSSHFLHWKLVLPPFKSKSDRRRPIQLNPE
jgi:hypothetical protein